MFLSVYYSVRLHRNHSASEHPNAEVLDQIDIKHVIPLNISAQTKPFLFFYSQLACIQGLNTGISGKSFGIKWFLDVSTKVHFGKIIPVQLFFQVCAHRRHTLVTTYFVANADERSNPKVDVHCSNKSRAKTPDAYLHFLRRPKPKNFPW